MNSYLNQFLIRFDFKNYELGKHRNPFLFEFSIFLEILYSHQNLSLIIV